MTLQSIYDSALQHPGIAWIAAAITAILVARRLPFLVGWFVVFLLVSVADAWATGGFSRVPAEHGWIAGVVFVILGDLRFFLLAERISRGRTNAKVFGFAIGVSMIVPVTTEILRRVVPAIGQTPRLTFLTYEVLMLLVLVIARFVVYPNRLLGVVQAPVRKWMLSIGTFEVVQYALWVLCDVLLLAGIEAAILLRIVPNALYYGAFLPFVMLRAPAHSLGHASSAAAH